MLILYLWRPFNIKILASVSEAMISKSTDILLEALQPTLNYDIKSLTIADYYYLMYWLRLNSYPNSPLFVEWTSRYGNKQSTRVDMKSFEVTELKMTKQEYLQWISKGFCFPTMRDFVYQQNSELKESEKWMVSYAQYIVAADNKADDKYMKRKIQAFEDMGVDAITEVTKFSEHMTHGVVEQVTTRDEKFDIDAAISFISNEIEELTKLVNITLEKGDQEDILNITNLAKHVDSKRNELEDLQQHKEEDKTFIPIEEDVTLTIDDPSFLFPQVPTN